MKKNNMITEWLDKHGSPEIEEQVKQEAKEMHLLRQAKDHCKEFKHKLEDINTEYNIFIYSTIETRLIGKPENNYKPEKIKHRSFFVVQLVPDNDFVGVLNIRGYYPTSKKMKFTKELIEQIKPNLIN